MSSYRKDPKREIRETRLHYTPPRNSNNGNAAANPLKKNKVVLKKQRRDQAFLFLGLPCLLLHCDSKGHSGKGSGGNGLQIELKRIRPSLTIAFYNPTFFSHATNLALLLADKREGGGSKSKTHKTVRKKDSHVYRNDTTPSTRGWVEGKIRRKTGPENGEVKTLKGR